MLQVFSKDGYLIARFRDTSSTEPLRPTLRLALLLDISDSMRGERLKAVKRTLEAIRGLLKDSDRLTIVTFGSEATVLAAHVAPSPAVFDAIAALETAGSTNLQAGLECLAAQTRDDSSWDAVFLLTDGQVNVGITNTGALQAMAAGIRGRWRSFYCLGYGADHNRKLLRNLAVNSRGSYVYITEEERLPAAMATVIAGLRLETLGNVHLLAYPEAAWETLEVGSSGATHCVGAVQPERDYWAVWRRRADASTSPPADTCVQFSGGFEGGGVGGTGANASDGVPDEVAIQIWRARAARILSDAADALEGPAGYDGNMLMTGVDELLMELSATTHPLLLRIKAQLTELKEQLGRTRGLVGALGYTYSASPTLLATISAEAAYLSSQQPDCGDPHDYFATPAQRYVSRATQEQYAAQEA